MGRKKQRKDDYWDSAQSQADYELLAAENENLQTNLDNEEEEPQQKTPKKNKSAKKQKAQPQPEHHIPEPDPEPETKEEPASEPEASEPPVLDLGMNESDPEDEARDFTYGELDAAGVKALEWLRESFKTKESREGLPVTKEALAEAINSVCYVSRKVPMRIIFAFLVEIGVLIATPVTELKEDELDHLDPNPQPLDNPSLEGEVRAFSAKIRIRYADNWEPALQSRKTKRTLGNLLPIHQQCFPKIFDKLKELNAQGKLGNYSDSILRVFAQLPEFKHPIPPEFVVEWLEEEGYIKLHEKVHHSKKSTITTCSVEYLNKIWKGPGMSLSHFLLYFLFILGILATIGKTVS